MVVTNASGCSKASTVITVTVNPLPTATITANGPLTFCAGGSVLLSANSGAGITYQWKKFTNNISGATSQNYTATTAGKYKCVVTNSNNCSKSSNALVVATPCRLSSGTPFEESGFLSIFPNPSSTGNFSIHISDKIFSEGAIEVYDGLGKRISLLTTQQQNEVFNLHIHKNGIYFLRYTTNTAVYFKKLVKSE